MPLCISTSWISAIWNTIDPRELPGGFPVKEEPKIDKKQSACACKQTSIGGQALIEGIMMRGPHQSAMAVRRPDKSITTETWTTFSGGRKWYHSVPIVRGCVSFVESLRVGYRCLMRSADLAGFEEEPSGFEKKLIDKFGKKASDALTYLAMFIGVMAAVLLFMVLPSFLVGLLGEHIPGWSRTILEGVLNIALFVLYLAVVSRSEDMHRMFQFHGAEHKTIACYEAGEELTPENVKKYTRFHPRCGTSFLLIVLVVSMLVFSFITWDSLAVRVLLKLILLPVTVGISFEIIRYAGRYSNPLTRLISAPGLWLQRLTTAEPDTEHIEVAIAAMLPCIPDDGSDQWGN